MDPKAAAAGVADSPDLDLFAKKVEQGDLVHVRRLGRYPDREVVGLFPEGHGPRRLGGNGIGQIFIAEGPFGYDVGLGEPTLHIPHDDFLQTLGSEKRGPRWSHIARKLLIQLGRTGLQGLFRIEDGGQDFVLHRDQPQGFPGDLLRSGGHQGHRVAYLPGFTVEDPLAAGRAAPPVGYIFPGEHGSDSREGQGPALVHFTDQGMGVGAAQHFAVQQVGKLKIIDIPGAPSDDLPGIPAWKGFADITVDLGHGSYLPL